MPSRQHSENKCHLQTIRLLPLWLHTTPAFTPLVQPCWQGRRGQCFLSLCRITFHRAAARLAATTHCGYCNVAEREREKKKNEGHQRSSLKLTKEKVCLCVCVFSFCSLQLNSSFRAALLHPRCQLQSINLLISMSMPYRSMMSISMAQDILFAPVLLATPPQALSFNLPDLLESVVGKSQKVTSSDLSVSSFK